MKWSSCYAKLWWFLKKLNIELSYYPEISLLGVYPEKVQSRETDIYTSIFIAAIFTTAKKVKATQVSDELMVKLNVLYIHTMKYYSALKGKEILTHATTWMNLEDIMLSEISQSQKDEYCMIPLK